MTIPVAILDGGLATRLQSITEHTPKVLVEVDGQPFYLIKLNCLNGRSDPPCLLRGSSGAEVQESLGDGSRWSIQIDYSFDGEKLMGTGGAVRKALPVLGEAFFVLYGDAYLQCDYNGVEMFFRQSGKAGVMTVFRNANQWDTSNVNFREGCIVSYDKHHPTPDMQHIDYGLGILRASVFENYPLNEPLDLATIYQDLVIRDQLAGFEVSQRFYEIDLLPVSKRLVAILRRRRDKEFVEMNYSLKNRGIFRSRWCLNQMVYNADFGG